MVNALPLFGEKHAIEFFSNLALMNEVRRAVTTPTPREAYIQESISSFKSLWLRDPNIITDPIAEGHRLATLLYKHASQMKEDKEFFVKAYFPSCFNMANMGGRFDPKWIGKEEQKKAFFGPFLNAASERFRELAVRDGFWDDDMEVEEGADVEMS